MNVLVAGSFTAMGTGALCCHVVPVEERADPKPRLSPAKTVVARMGKGHTARNQTVSLRDVA